jgi:hypothetical protein
MVMAVMTIFEALGSFKSKWVKNYINDLNAVFIFTLFIGASFFIMSYDSLLGLNTKAVTIAALCLFSYVIGISFPIQRQLINQAIPEPRLRASLLSSESIIDRGVNSLVAGSLGVALASGQLLYFLKKSAIVAILSVFLIAGLIKIIKKQTLKS